MKKASLFLFFCGSILFQSCQKCEVCIVMDDEGKEFYDYPEACGKKARKAAKELCMADYEHANYTCVCEKSN